ncbi:MAG TPA: hypothetical protein VFF03_10150 [Rhodocyclaceae bacterium]|nr:hypothetical protein [Rhodocyclaceae bacterium]
MALQQLDDGWFRFGAGKKWRCTSSRYLCEVGTPGNVPDYMHLSKSVAAIRRVKAAYRGRLELGTLDEFGYGLDVLVANSFTESLGNVPTKLTEAGLKGVYAKGTGGQGDKLDQVVRYISGAGGQKYLERREPGYVNPLNTPSRVSVGAHHVLISTALGLTGKKAPKGSLAEAAAITDLTCRLPGDDLYAAGLAIKYFNREYGKHRNQPPLLAASYNAGSPRLTTQNNWNLVQYGAHIDRWVAFFNTSRQIG